jgi:hypothetical protein
LLFYMPLVLFHLLYFASIGVRIPNKAFKNGQKTVGFCSLRSLF